MKASFALFGVVAISALFSTPALAAGKNTVQDDESFMPALAVEGGEDAFRYQLGMGYWNKQENAHGQFYFSHFEAKDQLKLDSQSLGKQTYRSYRLGIEANGYEEGKAYQGGLFLYRNKSAANIDRYGVGLAVAVGKMLGDKVRLLAGIELMPEYLSSDWDAKALLEYSLKAGGDIRLTKNLDLGVNYSYGATVDEVSADHYGKLMAGISFKL